MSTWTKEAPTPGEWWLSLAPKRRFGRVDPVIHCKVFETLFPAPDATSTLTVRLGDSNYRSLGESCFEDAQWKLVEKKPADPFAEPPLSYSQDNDLP